MRFRMRTRSILMPIAVLFGLVASPTQAAVITTGCTNVNVSCSLFELAGGATILVGDKLFTNWQVINNIVLNTPGVGTN